MSTRYVPSERPPPPYRLIRIALWLVIALEVVAILKLLPASALVFLAIALVALLALLTWNPLVTLGAGAAIAFLIARGRASQS